MKFLNLWFIEVFIYKNNSKSALELKGCGPYSVELSIMYWRIIVSRI